MLLKKKIKRWLYNSCPGFRGSFRYFGTRVFFPRGSTVFSECCRQGIYEWPLFRMTQQLVGPSSWYFDVGANIGLMSVPLLRVHDDIQVLSFEPSPNSLPYLERTWAASDFRQRWRIVPKAVGQSLGRATFQLAAPANGAFEGFRSTSRVPTRGETIVDTTTIDREWESIQRPHVSVIKCDVEGAELNVIQGARKCIEANRPAILTEWVATNLRAFDCDPSSLLAIAAEMDYDVFAIPNLTRISNAAQLACCMATCSENFLLLRAPSALESGADRDEAVVRLQRTLFNGTRAAGAPGNTT